MKPKPHILLAILLASPFTQLQAQEPAERARREFARPIVLQEDDKPAFDTPPAGFNTPRPDTPKGKLEFITYESKTVGTTRRMQVYTPPDFSTEKSYPVLYLLHGIGGDESEWHRFARVDALLDNLIAENKAKPMIVVMPNGRAQPNDRPEGDVFAAAPAFARFERDLLDDVIPAIEARYPVQKNRENRALAGLSMGGGQTLNFGLSHLDTFAWIGAFSSAPNTRPPAELIPDADKTRRQLKLLLLTCGNKDGLIRVSQGMRAHLKQHDIPHIWHVDEHGHDGTHWAHSLYWFTRHIFQDAATTSQASPRSGAATQPVSTQAAASGTLRSAYQDAFLIGAALNTSHVTGRNPRAAEIVARQFSSLTAENDMKWQSIQPQPGRFQFNNADAYFDFAEKHDMKVIGHTLVWHSQTPAWVFQGKDGGDATREELLERMKTHIHTVAGRYKGRILGWDVVNEALSDGGPDILRDSPWRRIIGDDFLDHAFRFAREADPDAELYYNDYSLENPRKRAHCVQLVKGMLERGVPIDGIGTQSHFHLNHPPLAEIEATLRDFAALGLKVMVTELDVDVLPNRGYGGADISRREQADPALDPYKDGLPDDMQEKLAQRYAEIFGAYLRHRESITRVTFWGVEDGSSWLNGFPIRGRTNHPLLVDRKLLPKPAFFSVLRAPASETPKPR